MNISQNNVQISQTTAYNKNLASLSSRANNNIQSSQIERSQDNPLSKFYKESFEIGEYRFFYSSPGDPQIFHVICKEISFESKSEILNDHNCAIYTFYYQLPNNKFFQITCEIVSHSLIVQYLNKKMFGIELIQDEQQEEYLQFYKGQKENLECHLKQYLFDYLTPNRINNEKPSNSNMVKQNDMIFSDINNNTEGIISQPQITYSSKL
ncbi:hypothetical protein C1645_849693 [Glomus cerebriforme]|uniref:Uncharacterized protein n=1 Tax=Glomus cerebriforme TaxID=658196 RepID=A0A397T1P7_9GLOM|nr:hypothetical protein C1645_849693 [Glomus cerebriforme]